MAELRQADLHAVLAVIQELEEAADLDDFGSRAAKAMRALVPSDLAAYQEWDLVRKRIFAFSDADVPLPPGDERDRVPALGRQRHGRSYLRTGDTRAHRLSEFMTRRQLHRTELYDALYKDLGTEYQIQVELDAGDSVRRRHRGPA